MKNCFHNQKTVFVQTVITEYIIISICFPVCHDTTVQLFSITQIQFNSQQQQQQHKNSQFQIIFMCVFFFCLILYETLAPY